MTLVPDIPHDDLVAAIEAHYDLRVTSSPTSLPPGFHSRAWQVVTTQGTWIAKVSDPHSDPLGKLERQVHLFDYLNRHGIRAPRILERRDGHSIATITHNQQLYPLQMIQRELLSRVDPQHATNTTLAAIGGLIAQLHQILEHYPERDVFIADRQKSLNEWGQRDQGLWPDVQHLSDWSLLSTEEQAWLRNVDQQAQIFVAAHFPDVADVSMALLHGDMNFEHLQFLDAATPYLYDFGDLCWEPVAHELAILFLNIFCDTDISFAQWEAIQQQILVGYTTVHPLPQRDRRLIPVFLVNRALARANYSVELAQEGEMAINWPVIQKTYKVAEHVVKRLVDGTY
jgi:Ser/Thr protein kinase RdoA (MazF antagonist)